MRARQKRLRADLDPAELRALYSALDKLEIAADWRGDRSVTSNLACHHCQTNIRLVRWAVRAIRL